ncbi:MAG: hypothetical protein SXQ77_06875 [Halobacteria archaeon]|nr:hypothetical protein [Halobacteria archaeon]
MDTDIGLDISDTDIPFHVGATMGITLVFLVLMLIAESFGDAIARWALLVALVVFILGSSGIGILISKRAHS